VKKGKLASKRPHSLHVKWRSVEKIEFHGRRTFSLYSGSSSAQFYQHFGRVRDSDSTVVESVAHDFMFWSFLMEHSAHPLWTIFTSKLDTDESDRSPRRSLLDVTGNSLSVCCHDPSPRASYALRWSWKTPSWIHLSILGAIARLNLLRVIKNLRSMKSRLATKIEKAATRARPKALMVLWRY